MPATANKEGDILAQRLIQDYWEAFTGDGQTWNFHPLPLRYHAGDRWASREWWIAASKRCIERRTKILFALEILLSEGLSEYLPLAVKEITSWDKNGGHDPEYYVDILARLPADNALRRKYLPTDRPEELSSEDRAALIAVEDETLCRHLGAAIGGVFAGKRVNENPAENYALPRMLELGPLCQKYVTPDALERAKQFCLRWLQRDREMAPSCSRRLADFMAGKTQERIIWARNLIAHWAWRIGWVDILETLRHEAWYWDGIFAHSFSDCDNVNLLVWSHYAKDARMRARALKVMRSHEDHKLDGAIAWIRMNHVGWPPGGLANSATPAG